MKKFMLGFVFGFIGFLVSADVFNITFDNMTYKYYKKYHFRKALKLIKQEHSVLNKISYFYLTPTLGTRNIFTGRCTKDLRTANQIRRDYFRCNQIQVFISDIVFGEYQEKEK